MNDKHFDKEKGPLFLYICGEYTCSVREDRLFPFMLAAHHNGLMVALEHRYYGLSQPFDSWKTENLRYLTSEQALSDIAIFLEKVNADKPDREVIVVGGSYPGALSAWFRERYPHLTVASWSSSGVVYPIADFWKFDEQIYLSTIKSGEYCPRTINAVFEKVEKALLSADPLERESVMQRMGASSKMDNGDFAFYFADIFVESVQYGNRTGLCNLMKEIEEMELNDQLDAILAQAQSAGVAPADYCRHAIKNTTVTLSAARPWTYQYCTEFGFY